MDDRLLFLVCPPRSGSTLLARVLGSHSAIYSRPEPHLIEPIHQLGYYGTVDDSGKHGQSYAYHPAVIQEAIRSIVDELPRGEADYLDALRAYTNTIYQKLLDQSGKRLFLDKTPRYALFLDFLFKLYPRARLLVLTRHPLAVAWSLRELIAESFRGEDASAERVEPIASMRVREFGHAIAECLRRPPAPCVHLRYEDLVRAPEQELARVCTFLALPFEPAMLDYGKSGQRWEGPGDEGTVKRETRPSTSHLEKWKRGMSGARGAAFARTVLDGFSDSDLEAWGYSRALVLAEVAAL